MRPLSIHGAALVVRHDDLPIMPQLKQRRSPAGLRRYGSNGGQADFRSTAGHNGPDARLPAVAQAGRDAVDRKMNGATGALVGIAATVVAQQFDLEVV